MHYGDGAHPAPSPRASPPIYPPRLPSHHPPLSLSLSLSLPLSFLKVPFDTIKTRLQTASLDALQARLQARMLGGSIAASAASSAAALASMESPLQCLRNTVSREGFRGLYRGCITPCMGAAVEDSISFSVYHTLARLIGTPPPHRAGLPSRPEDLDLPRVFCAGSCGGMATSFLVTPLELIKCRLQIDRVSMGKGGASPRYSGPLDCLLQSVRGEGLGVLYRGHSATFVREGLGTGVWFTTYELALRSMAPKCARDEVPTPIVLLAGALSGIMLNGVPYPFDTAKSVLQTLQAPQGEGAAQIKPPRGLLDAFRLIIETEGVAGLYRGITPALLRAMPANAAVFLSVRWPCGPAGRRAFVCLFVLSPQIYACTHFNHPLPPLPPTPPPHYSMRLSIDH